MGETKQGLNGLDFTSEVTLNCVTFQDSLTSMQVAFQDSPSTSVSKKQTDSESVSDRDNTRPTARKSSIISANEIKLTYHKLAVAFGICCIVMLFMLPIIFFYVDGNSDIRDTPPSGAIGILNVSQVVATFVYMHACFEFIKHACAPEDLCMHAYVFVCLCMLAYAF